MQLLGDNLTLWTSDRAEEECDASEGAGKLNAYKVSSFFPSRNLFTHLHFLFHLDFL